MQTFLSAASGLQIRQVAMTELEAAARTGGTWRRVLVPILVVVLLVLVAFAVRHLAKDVSYGDWISALFQGAHRR